MPPYIWDQNGGSPLFFSPDRDAPNSTPVVVEAGKSVSRTDVSGQALGTWTRRLRGRRPGGSGDFP